MDSAEKWKQFAEQLQAKQGELQEALAGAQAELQVGGGAGQMETRGQQGGDTRSCCRMHRPPRLC